MTTSFHHIEGDQANSVTVSPNGFRAGSFGKEGTMCHKFAKILEPHFETPKKLSNKLGLKDVWYNPLEALAERGIAEKADNPKRFRRGPNYFSYCIQRSLPVPVDCQMQVLPTPASQLGCQPSPKQQDSVSQTIRIDQEVWRALQKHAEPFVETPNDVLRRVLQLGPCNAE
ncbi:MAG: hypothetical protein L0Y72_11950 [Gemmataceae bacterium]|nr:hypothetical protein [Gemmataceae bacterium]MCI0739749.1 hypothetical protein [Gemmataceae bacterium]